ncbi:MAG: hypothetical protein IJM18_00125 [Clostridia bacterium]|jgi:hypothetical protein|nr:hypothetical protein [Clostridia bacterium]
MSEKKKRRRPDELVPEIRAASCNECTGLMPTPAEDERERLEYTEIETLMCSPEEPPRDENGE